MPILGRPESPSSVFHFETMASPRLYWQVNDGPRVHIINLHDTRNNMYQKYMRYQISPQTWETIDAFLDEMRYATEPNLERWPAVPAANNTGLDRFAGENWLFRFGMREDIIDLTIDLTMSSDDEDDDVNPSQETAETDVTDEWGTQPTENLPQ
jgi:hypothetical protein